MSRNKKPRKAYVPRSNRKDIISFLFEGHEPLDASTRTSILTAVHAAALALSQGTSEKSAWHTLTNALNIAQILCEEAGNNEIGLNVIFAAQNAMIEAAENFHKSARLVFGERDLMAVNAGIDLFEQLVETVTKLQYTRAAGESVRRAESKQVVMVRRGKVTKRFELEAA
jgi:hypothetical protein